MKTPAMYTLDKTGITQSMIGTCLSCPRKFWYGINRMQKKNRNMNAITRGNIMHDCLERLYKIDVLNDFAVEKIIDDVTKDYPSDETELTATKCAAVLKQYIQVYAGDWIQKKFTMLEKVFAVDFNGVTLRGKIDGVFKDKSGKVWIIEHKTKAQINEDSMMLSLSFDFQNLFYIVALETFAKTECAGALYNVIRSPQHKPGKATLADFEKRLRIEIGADPDHFFKRYEIPYTRKNIDDFKAELKQKFEYIGWVMRGENYFRVQGSCENKYGACEYLEACASGNTRTLEKRKEFFPELGE